VAQPTLVILARSPELGRAKTRLARDIGDRATLAVYRQLLRRTAEAAHTWTGSVLLVSTGDPRHFAGTGLEHYARCEQSAGGLGERLTAAMHAGSQLANGEPRAALVIGTDCPAVTQGNLRQVADAMHDHDCAFGPCQDGGFWAMASCSARAIDLLSDQDLPWSTSRTLQATRTLLHRHGLSSQLGPTLADVDTVEDLRTAVAAGWLTMPEDLPT